MYKRRSSASYADLRKHLHQFYRVLIRNRSYSKLYGLKKRLGCRGLLFRLPAQDGFAGGGGFVEATNACGVGRVEDERGRVLRFAGDGAHGFNELLEFLATDRFGWFAQHRAGPDQREVARHRMNAGLTELL